MAKPYLGLDLDARRKCASIALAIGMSPGDVLWALTEVWECSWRKGEAVLTDLELRGCTGPNRPLIEALCDSGFLEHLPTGWRVRGAEARLNIKAAQSAAGKAHASNLKRGSQPGKPTREDPGNAFPGVPAVPRVDPGVSSGSTSGSAPALSPSTQHRIPPLSSKEEAPPKPPKRRKLRIDDPDEQPDPRHAPLVKALVDAFPGYAFDGGRDAKAVSDLLERGAPTEVEARWRRALAHSGFPKVRTLSELRQHWNHFGPDPAAAPARSRRPWDGELEAALAKLEVTPYVRSTIVEGATGFRAGSVVVADEFFAGWVRDAVPGLAVTHEAAR